MWNNKQLGWKPLKGFPAQIISPWKDLVHFDAWYATFLPASGDESRIHDSVGGQKWYLHRLHLNSWLSHDVLQLPLTHLSRSRDATVFKAPHKPLIALVPAATAGGGRSSQGHGKDALPLQSTRAAVPFSCSTGPYRELEESLVRACFFY